jgi:hypothetical protein
VIAAVISSRIHCFSDVGIAFINDITISSKQHHHAIESCASQGRERKKLILLRKRCAATPQHRVSSFRWQY